MGASYSHLGCVCAMVSMGDVRTKMERGLKMSFSLEVVFLYLSYLSILFIFEFLFYTKGWPQFGSYLKTICRFPYPRGSCSPANLLGTKDDRLRYSVPSWEVLRSPFGHLSALRSTEFLMGWGGGNENSCTVFRSTTTVLRKIFRYRWVFTIMYVDHSYWRVQTFEGIWVLPRLC